MDLQSDSKNVAHAGCRSEVTPTEAESVNITSFSFTDYKMSV